MIDRENIFIIFPYFCLLFVGLVMVASSSIYVSEDIYGAPFHFASRQVIFFIIGVIAARDIKNKPLTFVDITRCQSSSVVFSALALRIVPAQLTKTSTLPYRSIVYSITLLQNDESPISPIIGSAVFISFAT